MINELVVHLGDTKTGSTSIQKALVQKAYTLNGESILYPATNHHNALARVLTQKRYFDLQEVRFTKKYHQFQKSFADYGIISAEHFQFTDPTVFAEAIDTYWPGLKDRLRLVAYVRPHADKLLSSFAERTKLGSAMGSLDRFFRYMSGSKGIDYMPRFSKWRSVFGNRFELRPFVREELYRGDAVSDFFHFMLGHENFETADGISANNSLTVPQLALLRHVQSTLRNKIQLGGRQMTAEIKDARSMLGRALSERVREDGLGQGGAKLRLSRELAAKVRERYYKDAAELDAGFFKGNPMSDALAKADAKTVEALQSLNAEEYFSEETVASFRIVGEVLSEMLLSDPVSFRKMAAASRIMFTEKVR